MYSHLRSFLDSRQEATPPTLSADITSVPEVLFEEVFERKDWWNYLLALHDRLADEGSCKDTPALLKNIAIVAWKEAKVRYAESLIEEVLHREKKLRGRYIYRVQDIPSKQK